MADLKEIGRRAKEAASLMATADTKSKKRALLSAAEALRERSGEILSENRKDADAARDRISPALLDRLTLDEKKIEGMAEGLRQIADLPDPVDQLMDRFTRPNGLVIEKRRVPLGVIGIIYESRPNVTADAFGLCFMSGNAVILRGGSDAISSNRKIGEILRDALREQGLPADAVQVIDDTSRESAKQLMQMNEYVDLLIPRGGAGLIRSVVENSTVPVIETGVGNCHIYVDDSADPDMAVKIIVNAKTQRMGVCNAAESLVIHHSIATELLPRICAALGEKGVEIRGDSLVTSLVEEARAATEEDYGREYLGPVISVKTVDSFKEAIDHINRFTTHHSEAIITGSKENGDRFLREIDAACVYVNASTRFTDGFEFGFGAEIGISTQKFHARGPMGLEALTSYKYEIRGTGQIRG